MTFRSIFSLQVWVLAAMVAFAPALTGCGSSGGGDDEVSLSRVEVTPVNPSIARGTTQQFAATAVFSDNTTRDVTSTATWASSSAAVATISSAGLATAQSVGSTTISAVFSSVTGSTALTVTPAVITSMQVTPATPSNARGTTRQFTATAIFSDATSQDVTSSASWSSSNAAIASVSNAAGSKGLATASNVGSATISALMAGVTGSTTMTVTPAVVTAVQVTPANPSIAKGTSQQFVATALFSDATTQDVTTTAAWASSNGAVASISNAAGSKGLATSLTAGSTTISAGFMSFTGSTTLTVTPAVVSRVDVTPVNPSVPKATTQQFTATAVFTDATTQNVTADAGTTWSSSNVNVAQVSNAAGSKGVGAALTEGTATISAVFSGVPGSTLMTVTPARITSITVTPDNSNLPTGFTQQFTATAVLSDGGTRNVTNEVTWISTNQSVATISNAAGSQGLADAVTAGVTTITAQSGTVQDSTQFTVRAETLTSIEVTPANASVPLGRSQQYTATGTFSDASTEDLTTQVTWLSSDDAIATISNAAGSKGLAQTVTQGGPITITATHPGTLVAGSTNLTVSAAALTSIAITPDTASVPKGLRQQYLATGTFSDGSTADVTASATWSSSSAAVATIENGPNGGRATATGVGTATITAAQGAINDTATITVTAAILQSIAVTPPTPSVAKGRTQQFTATGTFSDGTTANLTATATWFSSNEAVATVSNAAGSQGRASTLTAGTSNITAVQSGVISPAAVLTVTAAVLDSIAITPANPSVPKGTFVDLTATGTFSDGTTQVMTATVGWSSANSTIASVSNAAGSKGRLSGVNVGGPVVISAADSMTPVVGTTNATVTNAVMTGVSVTPSGAVLPDGFTLQYTATAQFSDSTTQNVTTNAGTTWSSFNTAVATISNAAGSKGLASAVDPGSTSIVAAFNGFSGSTLLTVSGETLTSIDVTPKNATIAANGTVQYTAAGTFSGATQLNITTQVTWTSSNANAATISNAGGSQGLATGGVVPGAVTTISATQSTVSGSTTLTRSVP